MEEKTLSIAFADSLKEESISCIGEFAEIGLDAIMDDGILKDVPILSTAIALYKIGGSIKERHNLKKLLTFLKGINQGINDTTKRERYREKFQRNEKFRNQELEYLLVILDRYIDYDKPKLLAKLYLAYLDEEILWKELTMYASIIDHFLPDDYSTLTSFSDSITVHRCVGGEAILRLVALGLMRDVTNMSPFKKRDNGNLGLTFAELGSFNTVDKVYRRTEFGDKLVSILK